MNVHSVGVIGAGGAGLVSAKAILDHGLVPVVYEARDGLGGNWRYDPDPGGFSSSYASLRANTSRWRTSLAAYRLPLRGPAFLTHSEMLAYLDGYATRFGVKGHVRTGAHVVQVVREDDGWLVRTADGHEQRHAAVIVATGFNSVPAMPDWPGSFDGQLLHTHDYRVPEPFAGAHVIVVGSGSSGIELGCEIAAHAASVTFVARRGNAVIKRWVGGLPADLGDTEMGSRVVPFGVRRRILGLMARASTGDLTRYGFPPYSIKRAGTGPVAVCQNLRRTLREGRATAVTGTIASLDGDHVVLEDGRRLPATVVIAATGYRVEHPFLDPDLGPELSDPGLYRGCVSLDAQDLYFVGLIAGHGALLPMFESQADFVASVIARRHGTLDRASMAASVAADRRMAEERFDARYGYYVDRLPYVRALRRDTQGMSRERVAQPTIDARASRRTR